MLVPPPPLPVDAARPVVAGPVLTAGRMAWVEQRDDRLVVKAQSSRGRVRVLAIRPIPPGLPAERDRYQTVTGFDAAGGTIILRRDVSMLPPPPGGRTTPGPPQLLGTFVDRGPGGAGRWTTRRLPDASPACGSTVASACGTSVAPRGPTPSRTSTGRAPPGRW